MNYLHYKGYKGSVEYSEADNCLFGKVLGLTSSLILYEGNSLDELKKDFEAGVESYLEGCIEDGIHPEKPYNEGVLNIHIPFETHIRIAAYAENHGTNIDDFICNSIERQLESVY
jgi:predicted HicB family RNase H-like nuclease